MMEQNNHTSEDNEFFNMKYMDIIDIRETNLYDHISFTKPDTSHNIIAHILKNFPCDTPIISVHDLFVIPLKDQGPLVIRPVTMMPSPDWIHAIHIRNFGNVKKVLIYHTSYVNPVFVHDVETSTSEIGVPMAFSSTSPSSVFYDCNHKRTRLSVLPCMPRFDSTVDWNVVLEPLDNTQHATCSIHLNVGYMNPWNNTLKRILNAPEVKYYMNGKEFAIKLQHVPLTSNAPLHQHNDACVKELDVLY